MSNWGGTHEFCLKADLAAVLGTTNPRNIAKDDAGVAPTGNLEVNSMFSPGPLGSAKVPGCHVITRLTRL
jgi:hypothetical protein